MLQDETELTPQERKWILEKRVLRLTDNKEVQIYPMGAERYLFSMLSSNDNNRNFIKREITGKDILVIPGHGTSCFYFAYFGSKSVTVYDTDPVTIAWVKAFKKFYHYRGHDSQVYPSVGDIIIALTRWYPPYLRLPVGNSVNYFYYLMNPNALRCIYIHYMLLLVQKAVQSEQSGEFELSARIHFHPAKLDSSDLSTNTIYDTAFVPYLLGGGIENQEEIIQFIKLIVQFVPKGHILITPSHNTKEYYYVGKRYFVTTGLKNIHDISGVSSYIVDEYDHWYRTQGLVVLKSC
ncbi:TPA: ABC transporter permease [Legionella pneumophila]